MKKHLRLLACILGIALFTSSSLYPQSSGQTSVVTGVVSNAATGDLLRGARVAIPSLGMSVLTDESGRYELRGVAPGEHQLSVSYTGLDTMQKTVAVTAGGQAQSDFTLTTDVYVLGEFKVAAEREGNAAAITEQRNALNLKSVATIDSFGTLPHMSFGELSVRLPGVATGSSFNEGVVTGLSVRGISPGLNSVTVDGAAIATNSLNRAFEAHTINAAMFEQVEVIKGLTPDKSADSIGGTVNMKSRSPLSLKEKRRINYNLNFRWAPPFTDHMPMRSGHRLHPQINIGYQEVFDVFGGERNLGVFVNVFRNDNAIDYYSMTQDHLNVPLGQPAAVWSYQREDAVNKRIQNSLNVKVDYRLSDNTKISLNTMDNYNIEPERTFLRMRAFTSQTVGTTGTAGILPGFTDDFTQVRATANSIVDSTTQIQSYRHFLRSADLGVEHDFGALKIDYNLVYSRSKAYGTAGNSDAGWVVHRINNVGWTVDSSTSTERPVFKQTEGPDITNPANYTVAPAANNGMFARDQGALNGNREVRANLSYRLPVAGEHTVKTGAMWREQRRDRTLDDRRWAYTGTAKLPHDPSYIDSDPFNLPFWNPRDNRHPTQGIYNPTVWSEDVYFHEMAKYTNTTALEETITAGYVMASGKLAPSGTLNRTGYLAGVRTERTENVARGFVRAPVLSTTAERTANPYGAGQRDYNNPRTVKGDYTQSFPSVHLNHDFTDNIKARVSWSTGFGRPPVADLYPSETVDETARTVSVSNPSVLPQTAENWDVTLDYFFEPVGNLSVGWFHKTIDKFIVAGVERGVIGEGQGNGFGGSYSGYTLLSTANAGEATVKGWEAAWQQQLTFLPGVFKGLGIVANFTKIETAGNFGSGNLSTGQVAGFIPETGNLSLSWQHKRFGARVLWNYTSEYLISYTANNPARDVWQRERDVINVSLDYKVRNGATFSIHVENITNESRERYRGSRDRIQLVDVAGVNVTFGVSGQF